jgi:hypothetical protein
MSSLRRERLPAPPPIENWKIACGEAASTPRMQGVIARAEERWPELCEILNVQDWESLPKEGPGFYKTPYAHFCRLASFDFNEFETPIFASEFEHKLRQMKIVLPETVKLLAWYYRYALTRFPVQFDHEHIYDDLQRGRIDWTLSEIVDNIDGQLEQLEKKNSKPRMILEGGQPDVSDLCYWCANLIAYFNDPSIVTKTKNGYYHRFCCLMYEIITGEERSLAKGFELAAVDFHKRSREYGLELY